MQRPFQANYSPGSRLQPGRGPAPLAQRSQRSDPLARASAASDHHCATRTARRAATRPVAPPQMRARHAASAGPARVQCACRYRDRSPDGRRNHMSSAADRANGSPPRNCRRRSMAHGSCRNKARQAPATSIRPTSVLPRHLRRSISSASLDSQPISAGGRSMGRPATCGAPCGDASRSGCSARQVAGACPAWLVSRCRVAATRCWAIPRTWRKIQKCPACRACVCRTSRTTRTFCKQHV